MTQVGQGWLDGATESPIHQFPCVRRLSAGVPAARRSLALAAHPVVGAARTTARATRSARDQSAARGRAGLDARTALLGLALIVDALVVVFIIAVLLRRSWQALRTLDLSGRGWGQNEASRTETARLLEDGYIGLVCGHSHRPELTAIGADGTESLAGKGFFANAGSCTPVVEAVPGGSACPRSTCATCRSAGSSSAAIRGSTCAFTWPRLPCRARPPSNESLPRDRGTYCESRRGRDVAAESRP